MRRLARLAAAAALAVLVTLVAAPTAAAERPTDPKCTYVPADIYGYRFDYYCWGPGDAAGKSGETHVNNMSTGDIDPAWTNGGIGNDCSERLDAAPIDDGSPYKDNYNEKWDGRKFFQEQCVAKLMKSWLGSQDGDSDHSTLANPCQTLKPDSLVRQCVNPVGQNACLVIPNTDALSAGMRAKCSKDHDEFLQKFPGDPGNKGGSSDGSTNTASSSPEVSGNIRENMENLLGYAAFGSLILAVAALMVGGSQLALARRRGDEMPLRLIQIGWVILGVFIVGLVSSLALMITNVAGL